MAEDWLTDVQKYVPNADEAAVAGIVRHCGIALRNRDSSLVAFSDPAETGRVRDNFLKKKLGRTEDDDALDSAIAAVGERMKGDRTKNRVTVYYLLAEHFGQLSLFHGKAGVAAAGDDSPTGVSDIPVETGNDASGDAAIAAGAGLATGALGLAASETAAAEAAATPPAPPPPPPAPSATASTSGPGTTGSGGSSTGAGGGGSEGFADVPGGNGGGSRWWLWALLALLALLILFFLLRSCQPQPAATDAFNTTTANITDTDANNDVANDTGAMPGDALTADANSTEAVPPAPAGAGVTALTRDGAPALNVYFDKGKSDVTNDFTAAAAKLTAYLSAHPGTSLTVSGYNDPSGNAAVNAEVSKERAKNVAAALKAAGVPDGAVALVKPSDTTLTSADPNAARRVEVTVKQ